MNFVYELYQRDIEVYRLHPEIHCNNLGEFERDPNLRIASHQSKIFIKDPWTLEIWKRGWSDYVPENRHHSLDHGPRFRQWVHGFHRKHYGYHTAEEVYRYVAFKGHVTHFRNEPVGDIWALEYSRNHIFNERLKNIIAPFRDLAGSM